MRAVDIIRAKRDGEALTREAIDSFVRGVTDGSWEDYQSSALLMAIVLNGMNPVETGWLTDAMAYQWPWRKCMPNATRDLASSPSNCLRPLFFVLSTPSMTFLL